MSATHFRSGPAISSTANFRSSTFSATGCECAEFVVVRNRRRFFPFSPSSCINRATCLRLTRSPRACSSACTRGLP